MSRFDLFFILVDELNEITDYAVANKIVGMHANQTATAAIRPYRYQESVKSTRTYVYFLLQR